MIGLREAVVGSRYIVTDYSRDCLGAVLWSDLSLKG